MSESDKQGYNNNPTTDADERTATPLQTSELPTWADLTAFQRDILASIASHGHTPHGLAIKADLSTLYEEEINHGRLYPNLDDLAERDLVDKSELDKRTNGYTLTPAGEDVLAAGAERLAAVRPDQSAATDLGVDG